MGWGAIAGGVLSAAGSIGSGLLSKKAAKDSSSALVDAINQGINFQRDVYDRSIRDYTPFYHASTGALPYLLGAYGLPGGNPGGLAAAFQQFTQTPNYSFPLQQGNLALNRQLASSGLIGSGAALKDAIAYNQGYASQYLNNYLGGLGNLVNLGPQAAAGMANTGTQAANNIGGLYTTMGGGKAAGIVGSNNAISNAVGQGIGALTTPTQSGNPNSSPLSGLFNLFSGFGGSQPSGSSYGGTGTWD